MYIYIYMYVYQCICIRIHIHVYVYMYIHIYVYIYIYTHTYIYIYTSMYIYTYMYLCICVHNHTCILNHTHMCTHTHINTQIYIHANTHQTAALVSARRLAAYSRGYTVGIACADAYVHVFWHVCINWLMLLLLPHKKQFSSFAGSSMRSARSAMCSYMCINKYVQMCIVFD